MGINLHGYIEIRPWVSDIAIVEWSVDWEAAIKIDHLYGNRDYDEFGCLFGVQNFGHFRPIAAARGLPDDASSETRRYRAEWEGDDFSATWIGWEEFPCDRLG